MGRALDNAMLNVGLKDVARGIIAHKGFESRITRYRWTFRAWVPD